MKDDLLIIDTLSHGPLIWNDVLVEMSDRMMEEGINPFKIGQDLTAQMAKLLVEDSDYFQDYLDAWSESGVSCVSWTLGAIHEMPYSLDAAYHNLAYMTHILDNRSDSLKKVLKADDIERAHSEQKPAIIFNFQNLDHIGTDIDLLDRFYQVGFRIMQLTYNSPNAIGCGCTEEHDPGLSEFGLAVIDKLNELGVLVDVSHCGLQTSMDAALRSKVPIACTHTIARNLYEHDRGKTDEILQTVADRGGYIGILAVPGFLSEKEENSIDDFLDHLDYIVNLVGLDHVGLGTDFFGYSLPDRLAAKVDELVSVLGFRPEHRANFLTKLKGFEDYSRFPNIIEGIRNRGYSAEETAKLAGLNFLDVFRKVVG